MMSSTTTITRTLGFLWPSFLMAGVMEMVVFAMVDPSALHWFDGAPVTWPVTAVYTVAFFVFWAIIAAAAAMTQLLNHSAEEINSRSFR